MEAIHEAKSPSLGQHELERSVDDIVRRTASKLVNMNEGKVLAPSLVVSIIAHLVLR